VSGQPSGPAAPPEVGRWVSAGLLLYPIVVWGLAFRFDLPLLDAAFLGAMIAVLPTLAVAQIPLAAEAQVERIPAYVASALTISALALAGCALGYRRAGWGGLGLGAISLQEWATWSAAVLIASAGVVLLLYEVRRRAGIPESPLLKALIPRSRQEKWLFAGLSLAAGVGEEVAFRGYALGTLAPFLGGPWGAAAFTSVVFGLLHAYQGPIGMARTTLLGFLLAASFVISGSLWPAIAAHVALDLLGGLLWGDRLTD
jgi:membrane protease YdiL (CAAX protease family)